MNCADSQALEVFVGTWLEWQAVAHARDGGSLSALLAVAGALTLWAALHGALERRRIACMVAFVATILVPGTESILISLAAAWAWFRMILDIKVRA